MRRITWLVLVFVLVATACNMGTAATPPPTTPAESPIAPTNAPTDAPTTPPETSIPLPSATFTAAAVDCPYDYRFIDDVTIPDGTAVDPGAPFDKTWRIENNGCADWPDGTTLVFTRGDQMSGPASTPVPVTPAGEQRNVTVTLVAPDQPGQYRGFWQLQTPEGTVFGPEIFASITVRGGEQTGTVDLVVDEVSAFMSEIHNHQAVTYWDALVADAPISFTVLISNVGTGAAEDVSLTLNFADYALADTVDVIAPGQTVTRTYTVDGTTPGLYDLEVTAFDCVDEGCTDVADELTADNIYVADQRVLLPTIQYEGEAVAEADTLTACFDFDADGGPLATCEADIAVTAVSDAAVTAAIPNLRVSEAFTSAPSYYDCAGLPANGYQVGGSFEFADGSFYCVITDEGHYAVLAIETSTDNATISYETYLPVQ